MRAEKNDKRPDLFGRVKEIVPRCFSECWVSCASKAARVRVTQVNCPLYHQTSSLANIYPADPVLLAQIIEIAHTASLLHDDDNGSSLRRGFPSAFGNKLAVHSGDFLLGRIIIASSRVGDVEVSDLIGSTISDFVEGEIL